MPVRADIGNQAPGHCSLLWMSSMLREVSRDVGFGGFMDVRVSEVRLRDGIVTVWGVFRKCESTRMLFDRVRSVVGELQMLSVVRWLLSGVVWSGKMSVIGWRTLMVAGHTRWTVMCVLRSQHPAQRPSHPSKWVRKLHSCC